MARKKYAPSKRDLSKAWTIWRDGKRDKKKKVLERLKLKEWEFDRNKEEFFSYFKQQRQREKFSIDSKAPAKGAYKKKSPCLKNGETILTADNINLEKLQSYVVCGFTKEKIASFLGVTRTTLYTFLKENPDIQRVMDNAVEDMSDDVMRNGLLRLCKQHTLPDMVHASYMGEITTKKIDKHIDPSITAVKHFLANTLGWSTEPRPANTNNKGAIMRMLDDMNNGEESKDEKTE